MHVLEIVDDLIVRIFGQHVLTFAPNSWSDVNWKPPPAEWKPDMSEIKVTPTMKRLYHPHHNMTRDFDQEPLQLGAETPGFSTTALRFPRDMEREKLLAFHESKGIQVHRPQRTLGFGEACIRRFALKSIHAAKAAVEMIGDLADDVVEGVARSKLETLNDGEFDINETLDLSMYTFVKDLTDPLEVGFISRRKMFAPVPSRTLAPPLEPPILKSKETEKRKDRIARERALFLLSEEKKNSKNVVVSLF